MRRVIPQIPSIRLIATTLKNENENKSTKSRILPTLDTLKTSGRNSKYVEYCISDNQSLYKIFEPPKALNYVTRSLLLLQKQDKPHQVLMSVNCDIKKHGLRCPWD